MKFELYHAPYGNFLRNGLYKIVQYEYSGNGVFFARRKHYRAYYDNKHVSNSVLEYKTIKQAIKACEEHERAQALRK